MLYATALRRLGNLVRNYVDASGEFRFIESSDLKFAFSYVRNVVCILDKKNISIPEEQFEQWFNDMSSKIYEMYDKTRVRLDDDVIVFDIVPADEFTQHYTDNVFLKDIGTHTAAILETIDGAIIDDWGEDLDDEDEDPYFA